MNRGGRWPRVRQSFLTGLIVYKTLRAGAQWTVLDPSGPLAELTRLPELAPFSRHINLLRADPGILNPYRVVAEPSSKHFLEDEDADRAWRGSARWPPPPAAGSCSTCSPGSCPSTCPGCRTPGSCCCARCARSAARPTATPPR